MSPVCMKIVVVVVSTDLKGSLKQKQRRNKE